VQSDLLDIEVEVGQTPGEQDTLGFGGGQAMVTAGGEVATQPAEDLRAVG